MLLGDILRANVPQWTLEISTRKTPNPYTCSRIEPRTTRCFAERVSFECLSVSITLTHSRQLAHCHGHGPVTVITTRAAAVKCHYAGTPPRLGAQSGRREFVFVLFLLNIV